MRIIFIILFLPAVLLAQNVRVYFGYTGYDLSDQKSQFQEIVTNFSSLLYTDIPVQENLPYNFMFSASIGLLSNASYEAGLYFSTAKTNAYALYGDILGNVDFKSTYNMNSYGGYIQSPLISSENMTLSAGSGLTLSRYNFEVQGSITYPQFPQHNVSSSASYGGYLLCSEPYVTMDLDLYAGIKLSPRLGYRIGVMVSESDPMFKDYKVNPNGFLAMLGLAYRW
ncbi:MAG: hypothetical protein ACM34K_21710 [Bacillota bacterium]